MMVFSSQKLRWSTNSSVTTLHICNYYQTAAIRIWCHFIRLCFLKSQQHAGNSNKLSLQFPLFPKLLKSTVNERGFVLAGRNKVFFLKNKMIGFLELMISVILASYVLRLLQSLAGVKGQGSYWKIKENLVVFPFLYNN